MRPSGPRLWLLVYSPRWDQYVPLICLTRWEQVLWFRVRDETETFFETLCTCTLCFEAVTKLSSMLIYSFNKISKVTWQNQHYVGDTTIIFNNVSRQQQVEIRKNQIKLHSETDSTSLPMSSAPDPWLLQQVIPDSNLDVRIDQFQITPKMRWIHSLFSISHFSKFHEKQPVTV